MNPVLKKIKTCPEVQVQMSCSKRLMLDRLRLMKEEVMHCD